MRHQQIVKLMAEGATNHAIAESLGLSVDTIKHHATHIYRRLDVRNRAGAVRLAQRLGLLTDTEAPSAPSTRTATRDEHGSTTARPAVDIAA